MANQTSFVSIASFATTAMLCANAWSQQAPVAPVVATIRADAPASSSADPAVTAGARAAVKIGTVASVMPGTDASTPGAEVPSPSRPPTRRRIGLGLETDVVPYVLLGGHGDLWLGYDRWRVRAIAATFTQPSFFTPSGFDNQHSTLVEVEIDRFLAWGADDFRGLWVAAGGGLTVDTIDANDRSGHASTVAPELSAGVGWAIALPLHFYVDPWAAVEYQFTPSQIQVGTRVWHPVHVTPQFGVKIGWNLLL
jgi:hypothetical protein